MVRPYAKRPFCPEPSVTLQVLRLRGTRFEDAEQNATTHFYEIKVDPFPVAATRKLARLVNTSAFVGTDQQAYFRIAPHLGTILMSQDPIIRLWPPSCRVSCADIRGERRERVPARSRSSEGARRAVHVRQRSTRRITIPCARDRYGLFH